MLLSEYVSWLDSKEFNYYNDTVGFADTKQAGYKNIGNYRLPPLEFIKKITTQPRADGNDLDNTYTYGRHTLLDTWAEKTFPELKYKQTLIQLQKPGEKVDPHVDTLHGQIKSWIKQDPALANIEHSMEKPNPTFKARRYFIGVEDHVEGQQFILNGKHWIWKKGDCISLNVWRGVHNTINSSNKDRYIIKITGLEK